MKQETSKLRNFTDSDLNKQAIQLKYSNKYFV